MHWKLIEGNLISRQRATIQRLTVAMWRVGGHRPIWRVIKCHLHTAFKLSIEEDSNYRGEREKKERRHQLRCDHLTMWLGICTSSCVLSQLCMCNIWSWEGEYSWDMVLSWFLQIIGFCPEALHFAKIFLKSNFKQNARWYCNTGWPGQHINQGMMCAMHFTGIVKKEVNCIKDNNSHVFLCGYSLYYI